MPNTSSRYIGGVGMEFNLDCNRVLQGFMVEAPTTASTQATGTGASACRVNVSAGILLLNGEVKESAIQADLVLVNASSFMANGQSVYFDIIVWQNSYDNSLNQKTVQGTVATTANAVPPTDAEIEALLAPGTLWFRISRVKFNRTGDQTVTQTYTNSVRPLGTPAVANHPNRRA